MSEPGQIDLDDLRQATASGEPIDGRAAGPEAPGLTAEVPKEQGPKAQVAAALIREVCREAATTADPRGLRIRRAQIVGPLDLAAFRWPFPLGFEDCDFTDALDLEGADVQALDLIDCTLPGLLANGLRVRRDVTLSGSVIIGSRASAASFSYRAAVWLAEAKIGGRLLARGTRIDGQGERAIHATALTVGGWIRLIHGFHVIGEVRMLGLRVGGSLELAGFRLDGPGGRALSLADAEIGGGCFLTRAGDQASAVHGLIDLRNTRVAGDLVIRGLTVTGTTEVQQRGSSTVPPLSRGWPLAVLATRLSVGGELRISEAARVDGELELSSTELGALTIAGDCTLVNPGAAALDLSNARVRGSVRLEDGLAVQGRIWMARAEIDNRLLIRGVQLSHPQDGVLLDSYGLHVDGIVEARRLRADGGRLVFNNVECRRIDLRESWISTDDEVGLSLVAARVHGDVSMSQGFSCQGRVALNGAQVDGWLACEDGTFVGPTGPAADGSEVDTRPDADGSSVALSAVSARFGGGMNLTWADCRPRVDFTAATTTSLVHETDRWPEHYVISGLTYDRLGGPRRSTTDPWDAVRVCAWLDGADFDAGAYEQAARVFRQHGRAAAAEDILIRARDAARRATYGRRSSSGSVGLMRDRVRQVLDWAFGRAVGYGFRPGRALIALFGLLVAVIALLLVPSVGGSLRASDEQGDVYGVHGVLLGQDTANVEPGVRPVRVDTCGNGEVRCFNRLFYSVDTVIPLVDLKQRDTWYPDDRAPWGRLTEYALDIATLLGWLLSSIVVLSFARLARTT